jgi:NitT/TauT family transport system permease protein
VAAFCVYGILAVAAFCPPAPKSPLRGRLRQKLEKGGAFTSGVFLLLSALNIAISKLALMPVMNFPAFDRILAVFIEQHALLVKCVVYSARLLFAGFAGGAAIGFLTGLGIGFNKKLSYWISPLVRLIGPIPSTAWIPIVLILFPTAVQASAFLVGLAVWFPVTLMTSSGIANIPQSYFDVGATLGTSRIKQIFAIGVPAASPHIFLGLFNGSCASFITLVTAELIGAKYGIGWYINWQKDMLSYANVYAGLIIIAVIFHILIAALFALRDKVLVWQKGVIKW